MVSGICLAKCWCGYGFDMFHDKMLMWLWFRTFFLQHVDGVIVSGTCLANYCCGYGFMPLSDKLLLWLWFLSFVWQNVVVAMDFVSFLTKC